MSYADLLKDPKWDYVRKTILKRDFNSCRACGAVGTEMHVHHTSYIDGLKPWEYDSQKLVTLCKGCHTIIHDDALSVVTRIGKMCSHLMMNGQRDNVCVDAFQCLKVIHQIATKRGLDE